MVGPIAFVTISVFDLTQTEEAYHRDLGYRVAEHGQVPEWQAKLWGAPAVAGAKMLTMRPEQGGQGTHDFALRFVETPKTPGYVPMKSYGWSAAELLVQDTDKLAERLAGAGSAFTIIGQPRELSAASQIRAMQAQGPSGEVLYLTHVGGEIPGMGKPDIPSFVDRCFIGVLAARDVTAAGRFYADRFGSPLDPIHDIRITVLSRAWGLPIETTYKLGTFHFDGQCLVECDQYPDGTTERPMLPGGLPPGMAIVTFIAPAEMTRGLDMVDGRGPGHEGKSYAMVKGAAGEWIELMAG